MPSASLVNRQLGRNVQLLIEALAEMDGAEARYPYLRSLVAHIEDVRPEWAHAPGKAEMMAHLITQLGGAVIEPEEIRVALAARDADAALAAEAFEVAPPEPAADRSDTERSGTEGSVGAVEEPSASSQHSQPTQEAAPQDEPAA